MPVADGSAEMMAAQHPSILDRPLVAFGREVCGDLPAASRREWLATNGLGGYASGTLAGINTRRYHGLLVAALAPPVQRTVLVAALAEQAAYDGATFPLSSHAFGDGTVHPRGYRHLQAFHLEGALPVWTFAVADALLERRVWMARGANTTYVRFSLQRAGVPVDLDLTPLVTYRDFHVLGHGDDWAPTVALPAPRTLEVEAFPGAVPFRLAATAGEVIPGGGWWWDFAHPAETARGLDDRADLYAPGTFRARLAAPGDTLTLVLSAEPTEPEAPEAALAAARRRQVDLLRQAGASHAHPVVQQLTLAADQFLVQREGRTGAPPGRTVIAGYHWFNDWGRDTMIALPGLTLATGRAAEAADVLRTFARYVVDGLLPNTFPDIAGAVPGYNTADASLWYVVAVHAYHAATGDDALVDDLLPVLREVLDRHLRGTRHGIGVDPADGLLRAGEPGVQLTWMDARVGDWVVTPRIGKPVEINALWHSAVRIVAAFLAARDDPTADTYAAHAERAHAAFRARFSRPNVPHLADVVDGPDGDDFTLRPNQVFAASLPYPLLEREAAAAMLTAVGRALLTTHGLRSLAPADPAYRGDYGGDPARRDGAYHQGPVWTWLMGAYVEAHFRVHGDRDAARALLAPFEHHLRDAGLGSVAEILEGDPPHQPRGAIAQAWGVAEILRLWRLLDG